MNRIALVNSSPLVNWLPAFGWKVAIPPGFPGVLRVRRGVIGHSLPLAPTSALTLTSADLGQERCEQQTLVACEEDQRLCEGTDSDSHTQNHYFLKNVPNAQDKKWSQR
jgi:hypothetical protein